MLDFIRKRSKSFVIQVLFGLLILSFVAWGIDGFIRGGTAPEAVAKVGDVQIGVNQVYDAFRREVDRTRQALGTPIDNEQAKALGIDRLVVQRIVHDTLIDLAGRDLGITVSDQMVRDEIQSYAVFRDEAGRFDRDLFARGLRRSGMTEAMLVEQVRRDLGRRMLVEAIGGGMLAPRAMTDPLYRFRAERRSAEVVMVSPDAIPGPEAPSSEQLASYHETHAARFTAPEFRAVTYIPLRASDLADPTAVPEQRIADLYAEREAQFDLPERRRIAQVVAPDEDAAKRLVSRGGPLADAVELGLLARDEMPLPALADLAFSLAAGEVGGPVQSPFGWHVIQVEHVEPPRRIGLDEARPALREELAGELALDALYELSTDLEDTLGGGATLEEAAATLNLKVVRVPLIDAQGLDADGTEAEGFAATPEFLEAAFQTPESMDSVLTEIGTDGYFVLRVDRIVPPALRPLSEVRDQVAAAWTAERLAGAAKRTAEQLATRVRDGSSLPEAASDVGTTVTVAEAFTRDGGGASIPRPLVDALFAANRGDVVTAAAADGAYLARLTDILAPDASGHAAPRSALAGAVAAEMAQDVMVQLINGLQARYGVQVNPRALDEVL